MRINRRAAHNVFVNIKTDGAALAKPVDYTANFAHDLGADAIAGQD